MPLNMIYLFVLASKQGALGPEKTIESPLPSSPSLSARAQTLPCVRCRGFVTRLSGGGRSMQQLIVLKQYTSLARGPKGWTLLLQLSGKWGRIQERKVPLSEPSSKCIAARAARGRSRIPPRRPSAALPMRAGQVPWSPGSRAETKPHRQRVGRGLRQGLARRCYHE